jgi:hypothetical protein
LFFKAWSSAPKLYATEKIEVVEKLVAPALVGKAPMAVFRGFF